MTAGPSRGRERGSFPMPRNIWGPCRRSKKYKVHQNVPDIQFKKFSPQMGPWDCFPRGPLGLLMSLCDRTDTPPLCVSS